MTETQIEIGSNGEKQQEPSRPRSGYGRLRLRHRALIAELAERDEREAELQQSIDRLLEQHKRLMQTVRAPAAATPWFESANLILAQLSEAPEPRALQVMTAALAGLQQRLAQIIMRVTA